MKGVWALLLVSVSLHAGAQDMAARHALIGTAYKAERYDQVARLIEAQLDQAKGTAWQDSLHLYLYKYGRAIGKTKGVEAGIAAAESVLARMGSAYKPANRMDALFDLSWIYYEAGQYKQCVRVDSMAVAVAAGRSEIPPARRGQAHQYLAFDYSILGDHRHCLEHAQAALDAYSRADTVPVTQWAESYTAVGVANWHLGRIQDAGVAYRKALAILGDGESIAILERKASVHGNLGILWQDAGDQVRSKAEYRNSIRLCGRILATTDDPSKRDETLVARSRGYLNLATVYFEAGDDGRAQQLLELAWADRSKVVQPDDPQLLGVRERMADIARDAGDLDKAEAMERAYMAACEKRYGRTGEEYIRACAKLGEIAGLKKEYGRADSLFAISVGSGMRRTDAATSTILADALRGRALMRAQSGWVAGAGQDLQKAKRIVVNIYGAGNYRTAGYDVLLAEQAFNSGRFGETIRHADSALAVLQDRVQALGANGLPVFFPEPTMLSNAILWKVKAERAMEAPGTVKKEWQADLDLAIASLARNRARISDAASKLQMVADQQQLFGLALDLAYDAYARSRSEKNIERFLQLSEANRSILLESRLNEFAALQFTGVPDSVVAREHELVAALDIDASKPASSMDLALNEQAFGDFLQSLERDHPRYFQLRYGTHAPSIAAIRKQLLAPGRQLLAYAQSPDHLYAVVVGPDSSNLVRMEEPGNLGQLVKDLRAAVASRQRSPFVEQAYQLYQQVFAPVAHLLPGTELLIIPDGPLHTVNFEMLLSEPGAREIKDHFLIQRFAIGYLLSATTALQFADLSGTRTNGTLAMAPGFTDGAKQEYLAQLKDTNARDEHYLHFVRQPFAVRTAQALGRSASAAVITGSAASEQAFREKASRYGVLFLGTHAEMNPKDPMYSRLVLSKDGDGTDVGGDGYLYAYELYELDLKAQLAVIAACETGNGKVDPGEGVRSLGAGFAYAGCPSLVASLWSIDEKVSAQIMDSFFKHLKEGMPKHQALRQTKLEFLATAQDELALPYYWAGLVLTGDVRPIAGQTSAAWWWLLVGAAGGLGVVFVARRIARARQHRA